MRQMRGKTAWAAGLAAEGTVERHYERGGCTIEARRWRGHGGEIDLVARDKDEIVFIEVKKSSTHAAAAVRLGPRQVARLFAAASEYLAGEPLGQLTPVRFDVALVDGIGAVEILENALAA